MIGNKGLDLNLFFWLQVGNNQFDIGIFFNFGLAVVDKELVIDRGIEEWHPAISGLGAISIKINI